VSSPFATLAKAVSATSSGGTVVLRGGTYHQGGITISKPLTVIAYPGETPTFTGASDLSGGWSTDGSLSYHSYTPMPVTDGSGISFTTCANQAASCLGKYPDQVWLGGSQLQQVGSEAAVTSGTFWVDSTNNRIYLTTTDVNQGTVAASDLRTFASVSGANVTLKGFRLIRYSNTASDYGVLNFNGTADNSLMEDMYISDSAFIAANYGHNDADLNEGSTVRDSTIRYSNWMGISANNTTSFTLDHDDINHMNQFNEFTTSPQSGALKASRAWYTKVVNSKITDNQSQGVWLDQSNYQTQIANDDFEGNTGSALFFEISDYLYAANNYFSNNNRAIKTAGSSDLYLVNNTVVGGADPLVVAVDSRSVAGCSDASQPLCSGALSSDRDTYHTHPATMTWMPSINVFVNNIFAYPSGTGSCTTSDGFCITETNASATVDISQIIHPADATNGIPQTIIDGNVYANGSGTLIGTKQLGNFSSLSSFAAAMAGAPVNISGFEAHGLAGNSYVDTSGNPTAALAALHSSAYPVPSESHINAYVPAGTKHYGVLWK